MYLVDNLSQQYNPMDLLDIMRTGMNPPIFARLWSTGSGMTKMFTATGQWIYTGDERELFDNEDQFKGWRDIRKQIPGLASYVDFMSRLRNDKVGLFETWTPTVRER